MATKKSTTASSAEVAKKRRSKTESTSIIASRSTPSTITTSTNILPPNPNRRTSVTTTTRTATSTNTIATDQAATFIRPKTVVFQAKGLKPNTRYYPFFNGVYVGAYCSTTNGQQTSQIKTNALGDVTGNFYLPGGVFSTGEHEFTLVDHIATDGGATIADPLYSSAVAKYTASGILRLLQTQVTTDTTINVTTTITPINHIPGEVIIITPPPPLCTKWRYTYQIKTGARIEEYEQFWWGKVGDTPPERVQPSGIASGSVWTLLTSWQQVESNVSCPLNLGYLAAVKIRQVDPLAQSFILDPEKYPNGAFVTSIDLFFRSVDQSTSVFLELRTMENGLPGPAILPGGNAYVPGYATRASLNATAATNFKFDFPIYLQPNREYCVVAKSPSLGYNLWCSKFGDRDVTTGKLIDDQAISGVLFKSVNDSTWEPSQFEDMKMNFYVANFSTTQGNVKFRPQRRVVAATAFVVGNTYIIETLGTTTQLQWNTVAGTTGVTYQVGDSFTCAVVGEGTGTAYDVYYNLAQTLPLSYITTTAGSGDVIINLPMHGLVGTGSVNDYVYLDDMPDTSLNGIPAEDLVGEFQITLISEDEIQITAKNSSVASKSGVIVASDTLQRIDTIPALVQSGTTFTVATVEPNSGNFSPATIPAVPAELSVPTAPSSANNTSFTIYTNMSVNELMIDYMGTELPGTVITENVSIASFTVEDGEYTGEYSNNSAVEVQKDGVFYSFNDVRLIATPKNEAYHSTDLSGAATLEVNMLLDTNDKNISPVIDTNGMSVMVRSYKIDNQDNEIDAIIEAVGIIDDYNDPEQNSEIEPGIGLAAAKFKSTINRLDDAYSISYNTISIYVVGNCPAPAKIDCYIRTSSDDVTHQDRDWQWVAINGVVGTAFNNSIDKNVINEWRFDHTAAEHFNVFDIKIVMRSTNSSIVPKIYAIRSLANNTI